MPNTILTSGGLVPAPEPDPPPRGGPKVAEELTFPRFYFSKDVPEGRQFDTQEEFDAAGGQAVWKCTPGEATAETPPMPPPAPEPPDEPESHTPRSRRSTTSP